MFNSGKSFLYINTLSVRNMVAFLLFDFVLRESFFFAIAFFPKETGYLVPPLRQPAVKTYNSNYEVKLWLLNTSTRHLNISLSV